MLAVTPYPTVLIMPEWALLLKWDPNPVYGYSLSIQTFRANPFWNITFRPTFPNAVGCVQILDGIRFQLFDRQYRANLTPPARAVVMRSIRGEP